MKPHSRKSARSKVAAAATLSALALLTSGCVGGGKEAAAGGADCPWEPDESLTSTVRIGYQKIPNGDVVVKDQKILESCAPNATITWSNFASGGDVVQAFGGKSLDLGLVGSSPATKALSAPLELPVSVVWIHDVIGSAESLVVRDGAATDVAGLKGKTIATPFGSTAHFSLLQAIADAGQDAADYSLVNADPEQIAPAWARGDVDAAWVWDPTLSELKKDKGSVILTSEDTAKAGKPTFDVAIADNAFIEKEADFLALWAKAQDYAIAQIADDPDKAAESVAVEVGVTTDEAKAQFAGFVYVPAAEQAGPDYLGGKLGKDLFATAQFLLSQDGIAAVGPEAAYAEGVDASAAEAAAKASAGK
ncbi:ABC transporter substrate-binding protein [Mumia zhuanghuii]|uniref:Glycine/betaine ABC transporter substrate-binding protein n=1 Tax=Mumia zhuanghuii TaxID=2585211 RepID=A0A5C4MQN7_9ACTN|nr:ABC transporter substrate-binding protein [Mumia zhuanghuii]TNC45293.1 glycine/betaine ABC transporter substrate-binding protein [Mumia zhuanghuii]TNC48216.1 glycine/betaine ABC transporter substrate-binding protein [Mumia zhuanghuii]